SPSTFPALIRSCDLVICVPRADVGETPALEAMACGRPVVATDCGSLSDLVIDDVTGIFVPPGDPEQLGSTCRSLLSEATRLCGYGMSAREHVSARYSWPRVAAETARVYAAVTERAGATSS